MINIELSEKEKKKHLHPEMDGRLLGLRLGLRGLSGRDMDS